MGGTRKFQACLSLLAQKNSPCQFGRGFLHLDFERTNNKRKSRWLGERSFVVIIVASWLCRYKLFNWSYLFLLDVTINCDYSYHIKTKQGPRMIKKRDCQVCGEPMGYCTSRKKTCSDKCRKQLSRRKQEEKPDETTTTPQQAS